MPGLLKLGNRAFGKAVELAHAGNDTNRATLGSFKIKSNHKIKMVLQPASHFSVIIFFSHPYKFLSHLNSKYNKDKKNHRYNSKYKIEATKKHTL